MEAVCKATGLAPSLENAQKAAQMAAAGSLTGDQFLALNQAEQEHEERMQAMGFKQLVDLEQIAASDRDSARKREMSVRDHVPAIGFYAITVGFFGLLVFLLIRPIPDSNKASVYTMLGSLGTAWVGCVNYYYGSSSGSRAKDALLFKSKPAAGDE